MGSGLFFAFIRWVILGALAVLGYIINLAVPEKPWEERRGLETIDYNNNLFLVSASVSDVAQALSDNAERWEQDVLGKEILLGPKYAAFVFRLRGHSWSIVVFTEFGWPHLSGIDAQTLSGRLDTKVIDYWVGDTSATIGYKFYEKGTLFEEFSAEEGEGGRPYPGSTFSSQIRKLRLEEVGNIWSFTSAFFVEQDAFDPGIQFTWFLGRPPNRPGQRVTIVSPTSVTIGDGSAATMPTIERVDYLSLKSRPDLTVPH